MRQFANNKDIDYREIKHVIEFVCSVRKLSKMTEKMSKSMLNGVGIASGSVMGPMVRSQAGQKFLTMVPGEVLLASLDALSKYPVMLFEIFKNIFIIVLNFL